MAHRFITRSAQLVLLGVAVAACGGATNASTVPTATAGDSVDPVTELRAAIIEADDDAVVAWLEVVGDVDTMYGKTQLQPIHIAATNGHASTVDLLLEHGAEVDALDASSVTPLHFAIRSGDLDTVETLIGHGADASHRTAESHGPAPIHRAAIEGFDEAIRLLLDNGVDADLLDANGSNALHWAVEGGTTDTVKLLIDAGTDLVVVDDNARTALHSAEQLRRADIVAVLEAAGATE